MDNAAESLKLVERLIKLNPDLPQVRALRARWVTPLPELIEMIPGTTVYEKAKLIGVSPQAMYCWLRGEYRPNLKQAKRIAKVTGVAVEDIHA